MLQNIHTEIAYCNTEMSKLYEEKYKLHQDKISIDMRLQECNSAIERYKLQLVGARKAKEQMYSHWFVSSNTILIICIFIKCACFQENLQQMYFYVLL